MVFPRPLLPPMMTTFLPRKRCALLNSFMAPFFHKDTTSFCIFSGYPVDRSCSCNKCLSETTNGIQVGCIRQSDYEFLDTSCLIGSQALTNGLHGTNETIGPDISRENATRPSWDQSPGLLIGLSNDTVGQSCAMNALVVSSNGFAMLFEHRQLVLECRRIADQITRIAILCHQLERHLLTASADQQRDMWALHPFGLIHSAPNLVILSFKGGLLL